MSTGRPAMARTSRVLAVVVLSMLVAGCSAKQAETAPLDHVTYMTGFGAVGRDAFVWVARDKGWFKVAGIEVDIQKGAGNTPNLTALKSNQAQFAAMDFSG